MAKNETVFMRGKIYWAKIFGEPRPNYGGDAREWTFEFEPDEDGLALLKKMKLSDRLKDKYEDRGRFITLKQREFNSQGEKNKHIRVYDENDEPWDDKKLLGNATVVDLKINVVDYGPGKKAGIYPRAIRVRDLVEYQASEFAPVPADEKKAKPEKIKTDDFKKDFGLEDDLDDEIPM